jgi:hypothetical protein
LCKPFTHVITESQRFCFIAPVQDAEAYYVLDALRFRVGLLLDPCFGFIARKHFAHDHLAARVYAVQLPGSLFFCSKAAVKGQVRFVFNNRSFLGNNGVVS